MQHHRAGKSRQSAQGVVAVEFALVLVGSFALFIPATEILRLSFISQYLATATSLGTEAAGRNPGDCLASVQSAFEDDAIALWLFDYNGDGAVGIFESNDDAAWPNGSAAQEVQVTIRSDGNLADGVDLSASAATGCGAGGDWILVRTRTVLNSWWARGLLTNPFQLEQQGWARNQA